MRNGENAGHRERWGRLPALSPASVAMASAVFAALAVVCAVVIASDPAAAREGRDFEVTGKLIKPEATGYGYGTYALVEETTGTIYALRSETIDLDRYVGDRVTVRGARAPEYEGGAVEGGPSLIEVSGVETGDQGPGEDQYSDGTDTQDGSPENTENTGNTGEDPELPARLPDTGGIGPGAVLLAACLVGGCLLLRRL